MIHQQVKNRTAEAQTIFNIGAIYDKQKNYDKAVEAYKQVLPIYRELKNNRQEGFILQKIGWAYYLFEKYPQALDFSHTASTIDSPTS